MKNTLWMLLISCLAAGTAGSQTTIVGGAIGNGDFESITGTPAVDPYAVSYMDNWHNVAGAETQTSGTATWGGADILRATYLHKAFKLGNDTGHTVAAAGEKFSISYKYYGFGGAAPYAGDDYIVAYVFKTASGTVDDSTDWAAHVTVLGSHSLLIEQAVGGTASNLVYTASAGDVGQTLFVGFGMTTDDTAPFPRIDSVAFIVESGGTTTNDPPPAAADPTAWAGFVEAYHLSGYYLTDADGDGVSDRLEFAHGGNPTNPADTGVAPSLAYSNNAAMFTALESNSTNPGITYAAEWTGNLTNGAWQTAWLSTNSSSSAMSNYNEVAYHLDGTGMDAAFFRNRIAPSTSRPNILLILADDLGYEDVSFNAPTALNGGTPEINTPELDKLANGGTIFTSAYVVHPFCGPSRMGLLSGRYPHDFGGPFNLPDESSGYYTDQGISTNEILLGTMLQDAGYRTGLMGKWHLGQQPQFHPNVRGFDEFYGFLGGGLIYWGPYQSGGWDYYHYPQHNGTNDTSLGSTDHITDVLTAQGSNFIVQAASTEEPFFLMMAYNAPHSVLTDARGGVHPYAQAHAADMALFPALSGNRQIYAGLVYGMDRCVGQLVQALKETGQYDNTLIVFLSDNGGRTDEVGSGKNGVLRGRKGDVTEGGFRVPMFMHWPGVIPSGVTYDHPVTALDFYPTFARLAETGIPAGQNVVGKDIWDTLLTATDSRPGEPIYTVAYSTSAASVGIRQDNWKAVKLGTQTWALYNITNDISETIDVSATYPSVLSSLVSEGGSWSSSHVQPLWWNDPTAESTWNANSMPHYGTVFVLP